MKTLPQQIKDPQVRVAVYKAAQAIAELDRMGLRIYDFCLGVGGQVTEAEVETADCRDYDKAWVDFCHANLKPARRTLTPAEIGERAARADNERSGR